LICHLKSYLFKDNGFIIANVIANR